MATMNISLPDQMKEWVEQQVATGRYANASDVVRDIIRERQDRARAEADLDVQILEGMRSGFSERSPEQIRQAVKAARRRASQA
jgi:antitoxin ParD1/3/4